MFKFLLFRNTIFFILTKSYFANKSKNSLLVFIIKVSKLKNKRLCYFVNKSTQVYTQSGGKLRKGAGRSKVEASCFLSQPFTQELDLILYFRNFANPKLQLLTHAVRHSPPPPGSYSHSLSSSFLPWVK